MRIESASPSSSGVRRRTRSEPALGLERRSDGQLWATQGERSEAVWVCRAFPWTAPDRFVSLRDAEENEFALVGDPTELDDDSREALTRALAEAGFVLEVVRIESVEEEVEIRCWRVETRQGRRSFQTRRDDWPRELPGGGLLIRDVAGDLFLIADPDALDPASRERLWVFVD